jgi:sugar lactone lactonase YvrE
MSEIEHVLSINCRLGEGPIWSCEEQALYWVDIEVHCFHRLYVETGTHGCFDVGLPVGALAFRASGGLVLATRDGFAFWDAESQALDFVADPEPGKPGARFNDGAVDRQGRFWAGTMSKDPTSSLYRLDPDGSVHRMESGVTISNGIGWSPDNRTMYYTDSGVRMIYAYDFDPATGAIENRRPFVHTPDEEGVPDGLTVDSEGCVWSARWGGWKVTRYDPDGKVEREIGMPVQCPTSCTFGGAELTELYITSAWSGLSDEERSRQQPWAGDLFRLQTGVRGFEEPKFAG